MNKATKRPGYSFQLSIEKHFHLNTSSSRVTFFQGKYFLSTSYINEYNLAFQNF